MGVRHRLGPGLLGVVLLTGCSALGTTGVPSDPSPSVSATPPGTYTAGGDELLTTAELDGALEALALADSGRFEVGPTATDFNRQDNLEVLPRSEGSWQLSTSEVEVVTTSTGPDGDISLTSRTDGSDTYTRVDTKGSVFGADCWRRVDVPGRDTAPPVLGLLDDYRAVGSPDAGTVPLDDVLTTLGFAAIVAASPDDVADLRMPVGVELADGEFYRVFVYAADLADALRRAGSSRVRSLAEILGTLPIAFWTAELGHLGEEVDVVAPPADVLLGRNRTTCPR